MSRELKDRLLIAIFYNNLNDLNNLFSVSKNTNNLFCWQNIYQLFISKACTAPPPIPDSPPHCYVR